MDAVATPDLWFIRRSTPSLGFLRTGRVQGSGSSVHWRGGSTPKTASRRCNRSAGDEYRHFLAGLEALHSLGPLAGYTRSSPMATISSPTLKPASKPGVSPLDLGHHQISILVLGHQSQPGFGRFGSIPLCCLGLLFVRWQSEVRRYPGPRRNRALRLSERLWNQPLRSAPATSSSLHSELEGRESVWAGVTLVG